MSEQRKQSRPEAPLRFQAEPTPPPSGTLSPETFWKLFLQADEWKAIAELRRLRKVVETSAKINLGLSPAKPRGRPKGISRISWDEVGAVTIAHEFCAMPKAEILRVLKRNPKAPDDRAPYRWLDRRLELGRKLFESVRETQTGVALLESFQYSVNAYDPSVRKEFAAAFLGRLARSRRT